MPLSLQFSMLHWEFDLGDEIIMEKHARVSCELISIKDASYKLIIVPPSLMLSCPSFNFIKQFIESGGYFRWNTP